MFFAVRFVVHHFSNATHFPHKAQKQNKRIPITTNVCCLICLLTDCCWVHIITPLDSIIAPAPATGVDDYCCNSDFWPFGKIANRRTAGKGSAAFRGSLVFLIINENDFDKHFPTDSRTFYLFFYFCSVHLPGRSHFGHTTTVHPPASRFSLIIWRPPTIEPGMNMAINSSTGDWTDLILCSKS